MNSGFSSQFRAEMRRQIELLLSKIWAWDVMKNSVLLSIDDDLEEMRSLLSTLGVRVVKEFVQRRSEPHRTSYLGPGKITEVARAIADMELDFVVINGNLRPSQHHFLEMKFQRECVDRTGVILRIFSDHAHTPEAKAQVTLARLRYEQPFLREWIHRAKSGDRPGFLAGGAYATDVYYEHAKTHIRRIEEELAELSKQREIQRSKRRLRGYALVSLAGYTNAGKSALMNAMCNARVEVDDRLFSTLSTTTRRISGIGENILMTDTVGFIKNLPPDLIKAFRSTLEEIYNADMILLVFDVSEDNAAILLKLKTSMNILTPRIGRKPLILVGNKVDLISPERMLQLREDVVKWHPGRSLVFASAKTGQGIDDLRFLIQKIQDRSITIVAVLPINDSSLSLISKLHEIAQVSKAYDVHGIDITVRCGVSDADKIVGWLRKARAIRISVNSNNEDVRLLLSTGNKGAPQDPPKV